MILVDSSVWIDYFRGVSTVEVEALDELLGGKPVALGDLMLAEVLQGFRNQRDFDSALRLMRAVTIVDIADREVAIEAARNFRTLRARGITVRKTIDTLIATRCIMDDHVLLYGDRDFDPFVEYLGLRSHIDRR